MYNLEHISWDQISLIWHTQLWPNRNSPIETHSAMTWPFNNTQDSYDMSVFANPAFFLGVFIDGDLVGVNSCHLSSSQHFRSRGLWVDPAHRGHGLAQMLFSATEELAKTNNADMIWSIPRQTALKSYQQFGFQTVGDFFGTETADANIYVIKSIR